MEHNPTCFAVTLPPMDCPQAPLPGLALLLALSLTAPAPCYPQDPAGDGDERVITNRVGARLITAPQPEEGFLFAVFGDRTGGPAEGIKVLAEAVAEVNLIDPDLVMTVGDLINGYNTTPAWMLQMAEYRSTMAALDSPWFPVAGNHDVYWRGEGRPAEEHEVHYEENFGPLWYAFEHKNCWFIVLYSDEPNPDTGERNFSKPECQRMSPEQFAWLGKTLKSTSKAEHVFVFVHHPRWVGGNYGDDWNRVHALLAQAGNVRAVFGGHIHHMRYDGPKNGIEYFTLATVGGAQSSRVPEAGWLHQYNLVHVRPDGIAVTSYPVGQATDPRALGAPVLQQSEALARSLQLGVQQQPSWDPARGGAGDYALGWTNPTAEPVALRVHLDCQDRRWGLIPASFERQVEAGESVTLKVRAIRGPGPLDGGFALPHATLEATWLGPTTHIAVPLRHQSLPIDLGLIPAPPVPTGEGVLLLDGQSACARVASNKINLPPSADFTLECWYKPGELKGRRALLSKAESSEFGLFVSDGTPEFIVHLDGSYKIIKGPKGVLVTTHWHHLAGVYDGRELRLYMNGMLIGRTPASGGRTLNDLPFLIGADVDSAGKPVSFATGRVDSVRLTQAALYSGQVIQKERRLHHDRDTLLMFNMDGNLGPWIYDASTGHRHAERHGTVRVEILND